MCGICGIAGPGSVNFQEELAAMQAAIRRRGPDGEGARFFDNCALGQVRQSAAGRLSGAQPMSCQAQGLDLCVVCDGTIYNGRELRPRLGQASTTRSDAEVMAALYAQSLSPEVLCNALIGKFAFALWDEKNQRLLCARDRFGEVPLYYATTDDNRLVFASEIRGIIASGLINPRLSRKALAEYLCLTYIPEYSCIYERIHVLEPGCRLVWENGALSVGRYWTPPPALANPPTLREAAEEVRRLARTAVSRCQAADVEVGLLLSGGLDSSTVAALASEKQKLRAFSCGFGKWDERPFARAVADMYGLDCQEITDAGMDGEAVLRTLCQAYGEPFGDSSAVPTLLLNRKVGELVKVALGGDGADEIFGGYAKWYQPLLKYEGKKTWLRRESLVLKKHWQGRLKFSKHRLRQFGLALPQAPHFESLSFTLDDALRLDIRNFLPSGGLRKVDRAAALYGLDVRAPFLGAELAEFVIALPPTYKVSPTETKIVMREAFSDLWPECVRTRGKQGFGYNVGAWLKRPDLRELRFEYLANSSRKIHSVFPSRMLKHYARQARKKTWLLLVLAFWLEGVEFNF